MTMTLNQSMHARNIYRQRPNFAEMAKSFPSFAPYVRTDLRGRSSVDYDDCRALRELTKTLLKKDFDLDVDIPEDRLIPTVPQRLNYLLFVEDLVTKLKSFGTAIASPDTRLPTEVIGLDVGTGCCAIFPLIGCTLNKDWHFVAVDVDQLSIQSATYNVSRNGLNDRINVIECDEENSFEPIVQQMTSKGKRINFLMTNPPFFGHKYENEFDTSGGDKTDLQMDDEVKSTKDSSKFATKAQQICHFRHKSTANTSITIESVVDGGEVEFVLKIIERSLRLRDKVMIYTTMLGKKSSQKQLKYIINKHIQNGDIQSAVYTEFCQGVTKRWGIAWTLVLGLNLREVPVIKMPKQKKTPLIYYFPPLMETVEYTMEAIGDKIESLLKDDIKLETFTVERNKKKIKFLIKSDVNVWSHQRKKRREAKRRIESDSLTDKSSQTVMNDVCNPHNKNDLLMVGNGRTEIMSPKKRCLSDMECDDNDDNEMNDHQIDVKKNKTIVKELLGHKKYLLDASLVIKRDKQSILMEMQTKELATSKESTHQLFLYFKNILI
ncbi:uncharacterized protein LOC128953934 [Oppia nitens]|uniref:uncharacterized protein LOC128953934 n=1 Tax=Oppia nitens TaxID=1686743 RepID=UPI0023D9BE78|nr:uncharacterized protein LOC128953934 [Oppia nitens]